MAKFNGKEGWLQIENLVGNIGRLVFIEANCPVDEDPFTPITVEAFTDMIKQPMSEQITVKLNLDRFYKDLHNVVATYCNYGQWEVQGVETGNPFMLLSGGRSAQFFPAWPILPLSFATGQVLVDLGPVRQPVAKVQFGS